MKATQVKIAKGRFWEHIEIDGVPKNPQLKQIVSSPLSKSETRFISTVTVLLQDVIGAHESGDIILCDAPGFGDTEGPEVDIANGVGVIEALRRCKSIKILALSSYKSLGDRGQGIQKLAHILINMMQGIETRLNSIVYAFTKYPPSVDINALLVDIKKTKVDKDASLRMDTAFVTVLADMIEKTENSAYLINPLGNYPKNLIEKFKNLRGIAYPGEIFRFSMGEETQASIIVSYFDKINMRVKELLERSKEHALEDVEKLISDMDKIRTIPELESRTAGSYYRTVENVRGFMQQLQRETEQLLLTVENQSGTIDYARHAKALLRLKNAEWMNRVSPGTYDTMIRHIAEELLQYAQQLECIQDFMDGNNFSEAEQGIQRLNHVQRELVGYFTSSQVTAKTEELRKKLDTIVDEISQRYQTSNIDSYAANPPKDLLAKLKQVASHGGTRYNQAYTTIIANIQKHFSEAIENVRKLPANERSARIRQLNYALCFIPEDMQTQFKLQIDALNQLLTDQEVIDRRTLDSTLESSDDDDQTITKIGALAKQYDEEKRHELFEKLRQ
ncbi:unnamed protein product, partial [Rotaria sordida]